MKNLKAIWDLTVTKKYGVSAKTIGIVSKVLLCSKCHICPKQQPNSSVIIQPFSTEKPQLQMSIYYFNYFK